MVIPIVRRPFVRASRTASRVSRVSPDWLTAMTKVPAEPADYAKSVTDFASAAAEVAAENMAAFAEVAKKLQMDTVELLMAAGKDVAEEATAAVQKVTKEATAAAKKAAAK